MHDAEEKSSSSSDLWAVTLRTCKIGPRVAHVECLRGDDQKPGMPWDGNQVSVPATLGTGVLKRFSR